MTEKVWLACSYVAGTQSYCWTIAILNDYGILVVILALILDGISHEISHWNPILSHE